MRVWACGEKHTKARTDVRICRVVVIGFVNINMNLGSEVK